MVFGEDKSKVEKIVDSNMEHFYNLYSPHINESGCYIARINESTIEICTSEEAHKFRMSKLPSRWRKISDLFFDLSKTIW